MYLSEIVHQKLYIEPVVFWGLVVGSGSLQNVKSKMSH